MRFSFSIFDGLVVKFGFYNFGVNGSFLFWLLGGSIVEKNEGNVQEIDVIRKFFLKV